MWEFHKNNKTFSIILFIYGLCLWNEAQKTTPCVKIKQLLTFFFPDLLRPFSSCCTLALQPIPSGSLVQLSLSSHDPVSAKFHLQACDMFLFLFQEEYPPIFPNLTNTSSSFVCLKNDQRLFSSCPNRLVPSPPFKSMSHNLAFNCPALFHVSSLLPQISYQLLKTKNHMITSFSVVQTTQC